MIYIDGEPANDIHPGQRDIAMVFQNLALYPDKTVFNNMAYPLRERHVPKAEIERLVHEVAKKLYIDQLLDRKPAKLSGGERQRVALGRAIVRNPRACLMDEPLANLDALLRLEMRVELKRMQTELKQTLVYVTHDQVEAMSMADRIAVLNHGRLQQCDTPDIIYRLPANRFVATVVGSPPMNFLPAEICQQNGLLAVQHSAFALLARGAGHGLRQVLAKGAPAGGKVLIGLRPEDIAVSTEQPSGSDFVPASVSVCEPLGAETIVDLHVGTDLIKAVVPPTQQLCERQNVWLRFEPTRLHVFGAARGERIYTPDESEILECAGPVPA
jgi:multiple sugar transport system ATP-binding protein